MKKLTRFGVSLFATSFLAISPNLVQAETLAAGDYFQLTVAPDALGHVQASYVPDNDVITEIVLAADQDIFLSNLLNDAPETLNFTVQNTTQGVVVGILNDNDQVNLNLTDDMMADAILEVPSEVNVASIAGILLELKNEQGDVLATFAEDAPAITYDKATELNGVAFLIEASVCGNSKVEPGEQCDDGNQVDDDACSNSCFDVVVAECGDGVVQGDEECDDGNDIEDDTCNNLCELNAFCGDGVVDEGEQCDDGNDVDDDNCPNTCLLTGAISGDGCSLNTSNSQASSYAVFGVMSLAFGALYTARRRLSSR